MKKKILCITMIMLMAFGVFALTGCGGSDNSSDTEKLVIGLDDTFAPMGFRDEKGNLVGFDIDLANAVGEELGMEVEFKPIDWNAKETELEAGTIDCVWNGLTVTPARAAQWSITMNYLENKQCAVVRKADKDKYNSYDALKKARIVAEDGSAGEDAAKEILGIK